MRVKYIFYLFISLLITSSTIFILHALYNAHMRYAQYQHNYLEITHDSFFAESFRATLYMHRLEGLNVLNISVPAKEYQAAQQQFIKSRKKLQAIINDKSAHTLKMKKSQILVRLQALMDGIIKTDSQKVSDITKIQNYLYNANKIATFSNNYISYMNSSQIINPNNNLIPEILRLNSHLNLVLSQFIEQLIKGKFYPKERQQAYLTIMQLTGELNMLRSQFHFISAIEPDKQVILQLTSTLAILNKQKTQHLAHDIYLAMVNDIAYSSDFFTQYILALSKFSQQLYDYNIRREILAIQKQINHCQVSIYSTLSFSCLFALFILLPILRFCTNINRWLTITHENILNLSHGHIDISQNEDFYTEQLAISDAIKQLRLYQIEKVTLEQEKHQLIEELKIASFFDPLTNIYNRRKFFHTCELLDARHGPLAFCLIDIDDFKFLNDTYGHDIGDSVLVAFSALLQELFCKNSVFCRYGGEEFAVLLYHCQPAQAYSLLKQLCVRARELPISISASKSVRFTVSIGIACISEPNLLSTAIKQADKALYLSKKEGKNRVSLYPGNMPVSSISVITS